MSTTEIESVVEEVLAEARRQADEVRSITRLLED